MTRVPQPAARRGSQKWIQRFVNEKPDLLNSKIREKVDLLENEIIAWLSPLKDDKFAEYRDQQFLDLLGVKLENRPLERFWPRGGPQWDALGKSNSGKIFLLEAKSHIPELISTIGVKDEESLKKIHESLEETNSFLNAKDVVDWTSHFYQYTNRLAHLYLMRELNGLSAYLVFVYFVNDDEMNGPSTIYEWKGAIKLLHSYLGI